LSYFSYFDDEFVKSSVFLDEIALKSSQEKEDFVKNVASFVNKFPLDFCKYKVLPEIIKAVEFSGLGPKALKAVLDIGSRLDTAEFEQTISPLILRLFTSSDRAIRVSLCENMSLYIDKLKESDVNEHIFKNIVKVTYIDFWLPRH
jgi:SCY1-like protein 1